MAKASLPTIKQQSKYRAIWDLGLVLDDIRDGVPVEELPWSDQMARVAFCLMVFIPLRTSALLQLDPSTERTSTIAESIEVATHDKLNTKRGKTFAVIRPLKDKRLCPLRHYLLAKHGAKKKGVTTSLWCSASGKVFTTADPIRKRLCGLIWAAGVPKHYTAYSIRHATISALYKFMKEVEVNAYTGHSNNSHTTLNYYYHLDRNWAGQSLATMSHSGPVEREPHQEMQAFMERDEEEVGEREGE
jgi:integrase